MKLPTKVHPIADLFPMMSDEELESLANDIQANGLLHPIIVDADNQIVDGRNRLAACKLANIEPRIEQLDGQDPRAVIVSANLARRNLTKGQQAMAMALIYPEPAKLKRKDSGSSATEQQVTKVRLSQARKVLAYSEPLARRVLAEPTFSLDDALQEVMSAQRKLSQHDVEVERLRKTAPDLADKIEEGKLKLEQATQEFNERLLQLRYTREGGTSAARDIESYPAKVLMVLQAIRAGATGLLTEEIVQSAVEATTTLKKVLIEQEGAK